MKFTEEQKEELIFVVRQRGMEHVLSMMDEILDRMRLDVMTFPLSGDANDSMLILYGMRCKAEGALSLKSALKSKLDALRYTQEGNKQ